MMISPEEFILMHEGKSYRELLPVRDALMKDIKSFEKKPPNPREILVSPSPQVIYQCNLQYMSALCTLIAQRYQQKSNEIEAERIEKPDVRQYDHDYWEDRADRHTLSMVYEIYEDLKDVLNGYTLNYTSTYIGIQKNGTACNFVYFRPQKTCLWIHVVGSQSTAELVKKHNLDVVFRSEKKPQQMKIRIKSLSEYKAHRELLHTIINNAKNILER